MISWPAYLANKIGSPALTSRRTRFPLWLQELGGDVESSRADFEEAGVRDEDVSHASRPRRLRANDWSRPKACFVREPRFLLRVANWLHLNRGKKAWTYVADTYAAALLFLAFSGLFMLKGSKGIIGRGAVFVLIGIAIPVAYVTFAAG